MASIYFISLVAYGMHPVFLVVGTFIFQGYAWEQEEMLHQRLPVFCQGQLWLGIDDGSWPWQIAPILRVLGKRVPIRHLLSQWSNVSVVSTGASEGGSGNHEVFGCSKICFLLYLYVELQNYEVWIAEKVVAQTGSKLLQLASRSKFLQLGSRSKLLQLGSRSKLFQLGSRSKFLQLGSRYLLYLTVKDII